jgi:hypothetical protein
MRVAHFRNEERIQNLTEKYYVNRQVWKQRYGWQGGIKIALEIS